MRKENRMPQDRFIIIKREDVDRYLPIHDRYDLYHILKQIIDGRDKDGKSNNHFYAIINTDEPYFEEIKTIMEKHGHWEDNNLESTLLTTKKSMIY